MECAPDIAAEPEDKKIERTESTEDKQEFNKDKQELIEDGQVLTKDKQGSNRDEEDENDVEEDIERPVSENEDQSAVGLEDIGGLLDTKKKAEKNNEEEIESVARKKLQQILKSRETLITNNVAEVITLDGDHEETIISSKSIDDEKEKFKGSENASGEEARDHTKEQPEEGKMVKADMDTDEENATEEGENKSGSDQPRKPVDHDYEAKIYTKVTTESGPDECSVEAADTTASKSGSSDSASVTTTKESSPGTSLRLVSLSNLVPNSPPPSEPIGNPTPSWTVAEVAKSNLILFSNLFLTQGSPLAPEPSPPLRASDVAPDTPIPQV